MSKQLMDKRQKNYSKVSNVASVRDPDSTWCHDVVTQENKNQGN